jgi:hypothetical protein
VNKGTWGSGIQVLKRQQKHLHRRGLCFSGFLLVLWMGFAGLMQARTPPPDPTLDNVLVLTRRSVDSFWQQFRSVTCVETMTQEKLGTHGNVEHRRKSAFDYLALMDVDSSGLSVEESRLEQGKAGKAKNIPMLVTSGVPALLLVFHPYYRESFQYALADDSNSPGLLQIRFNHITGTRSTSAMRLRGADIPLEIRGTAWIDSGTGAIHRIVAEIAGPMAGINLKSLQMDVQYAPQAFNSVDAPYWLPTIATIDITTVRQHWRNVHQYSKYRRFSVNTEDRILQ